MVNKFKSIDFNSLFDPEVITTGVKVVRIALIIGSIIVATLVIRNLIQTQLSSVIDQALVNTNTLPVEQLQPKEKQHDYSDIVKRNIFGPIAVAPVTAVKPPETKPVSKLPLTLIGTYVSDTTSSYAIIENSKSKEQDVFSTGERIFDEADVVKILSDRVEINRGGEIETLLLDDLPSKVQTGPGGVASVGENEFVIEGAELDKALENLPLLLQQARAVPYFKDGQSVGLRLFAIRPDSLYSKIGLRNGDILMSINGKSLADLSEAIKLFETMKQERSFTLVLERNRETSEFRYEVR